MGKVTETAFLQRDARLVKGCYQSLLPSAPISPLGEADFVSVGSRARLLPVKRAADYLGPKVTNPSGTAATLPPRKRKVRFRDFLVLRGDRFCLTA